MTDEFDKTWGAADPDAVGTNNDDLEPPADGTYDVELMAATASVAKSEKTYVRLGLRVVSQVAHGYQWTVLLGFKSDAQANMTKRQVRNLGVNVDNVTSLDGLDAAVAACCGKYYTVTVKRDGKFANTYIEEGGPVTPDIPVPALEPVGATATDDSDIPF